MKKKLLFLVISFSVPLMLFLNVWQSHRYMIHSFEAKGLIRKQGVIVKNNKKYINSVAELESPARVVELLDSRVLLERIGGGEIIRIEIKEGDE